MKDEKEMDENENVYIMGRPIVTTILLEGPELTLDGSIITAV